MVQRTLNGVRYGLTYVEVIFSSLAATAIMIGLGSVVFTSFQIIDTENSPSCKRIKSAHVLGNVLHDVRHAISFKNRSANAVTFTVPDRDGNSTPETLTWSWSGTPGDPLMYAYNDSPLTPVADDVQKFHLAYCTQFLNAPEPPPVAGSSILYVVGSKVSLTSEEEARQTQLQSWGYKVTLISDDDPQTDFDVEFSLHDLVYVSHDTSEISVGKKLTRTTLGVVSELGDLTDELGVSAASVTSLEDEIVILNDNHYITYDFPVNSEVKVVSSSQRLELIMAPVSTDIFELAESICHEGTLASMATMNPGDELHGGGSAAGRRAFLPWGGVALPDLTGEGIQLLRRTLEWAAGAGPASPKSSLLMVVTNVDSLTSQEQQRRALLLDWGYRITLIASSDTQANFDLAIAKTDIGYIPASIVDANLDTKLRGAAIGIVNEANQLHQELGLMSGGEASDNDEKHVRIIDKGHYITQFFPIGRLKIFDSDRHMSRFPGNLGNAHLLAHIHGNEQRFCLATLDTGKPMKGPDSDPAPARRVYLPWGGLTEFDISSLTADGKIMLQRSLEWASGANAIVPKLLLVVDGHIEWGDPDPNLIAADELHKAELERFGYNVMVLGAKRGQSEFNTAIASVDVAYVTDSVVARDLDDKLDRASIGVVSEERDSHDEFGFSSSGVAGRHSEIHITNTTHYITQLFDTGPLIIYTGRQDLFCLNGSIAGGFQTLATHIDYASRKAVGVIAAGQPLDGGGNAAGRRVKLPWDRRMDFTKLNTDGLTIMERSVAWAHGNGPDGTPDGPATNLGYEDVFPSGQTSAAGMQIATQVTLPVDGLFNGLSGYFNFHDRNTRLRCGIYTDNTDEPGNLVTETGAVRPDLPGPQWSTIELPPVQLPAGTYWIAFGFENNDGQYYYESDSSQEVRYKTRNLISKRFSTSWGTSDGWHTRRISFYATYTPFN